MNEEKLFPDKKAIKLQFVFFLCIGLISCATGPTKKEIESANYGPKPNNPRAIAENWVKNHLIDPKSARFDHHPVRKGHITSGFNTDFGWIQCGTVNAKNRLGGYTGREYYYVLIRNGSIVHGFIDKSKNKYNKPARDVCERVHKQ